MNHLGHEVTVGVYTLARLTRGVLRRFISWSHAFIPDPIQEVWRIVPRLDVAVANALVKDVLVRASWRWSCFSPEIQSLLDGRVGQLKLLELLLQKHHPDISLDAVDNVYKSISDFTALIGELSGRVVVGESEIERQYLVRVGLLPAALISSEAKPEDWASIDKILLGTFHYRPGDLEDLTIPEIALLMASVSEERGRPADSIAQARAYGKLTPMQKLELATLY